MVILKTLTGTLVANVNEITFTDAIIDSNSIIEVYYNSNDVYTVETWQRDNTIGIVTSDHDFPVGVKVLINNVVAFSPYDDTDLVNRISGDEDDISALDGRLDTAEDNITSLDGRLDTAEDNITTLGTSKQDVLTAGDNIIIENNVISASSGFNYSTNEHIVGTWLNGETIYEISHIHESAINLTNNAWITVFTIGSSYKIVSAEILRITSSNEYSSVCCNSINSLGDVRFQVFNSNLPLAPNSVFTIRYIK
jgi:hypothetical protein